jgi:hypothetical protein
VEIPDGLIYRYDIAFLTGKKEQMDRVVALAKGKRGAEHRVANAQALVAARSGQLLQARELSSRAVNLAQQQGAREAVVTYQAVHAVWEALYGNGAEAKKNAEAALALSKERDRDVEYAAGLALGFAGDASGAEARATDLEKNFPEDTFAKYTYVPVLRALASYDRGRPPEESRQQLEITRPYELASNGLNVVLYMGGLHSAYVRGEVLFRANRHQEAAAEFQKILDHRGIVGVDPIGALAQLELGRALDKSGEKAKAKAAYEAFFAILENADQDLPILKKAKAEYASL